jgi:DNA modification methylase
MSAAFDAAGNGSAMITQLYHGDALEVLRTLPDASVHCCVTSPPYYGLRDYGNTAQIGLENTPQEYVVRLVEVFREVYRVLRDDGTCWVNLGDSYGGNSVIGRNDTTPEALKRRAEKYGTGQLSGSWVGNAGTRKADGTKSKDLLGIPWRVAFALQADGWYLRSDIIWHKLNPMPESVTDRPTKAHEYVFLLTKSARYWYDAAAIAEKSIDLEYRTKGKVMSNPDRLYVNDNVYGGDNRSGLHKQHGARETRNARTVWSMSSTPYHGAHFAVMPPKLVQRCILAGCPEGGIVLDPFAGSGTTGDVARNAGRRAVLIELNAEYCKLIQERLAQQILPLFEEE